MLSYKKPIQTRRTICLFCEMYGSSGSIAFIEVWYVYGRGYGGLLVFIVVSKHSTNKNPDLISCDIVLP